MLLKFRQMVKFVAFPFFIFLINLLLYLFSPNWYKLNSIDTPIHFLGGLSIALSSAYALRLVEKKRLIAITNRLLKMIIIVSFVVFIAVLWEFYEFISDKFFGTGIQPTYFDTLKDLYMGMFGAIFYCAVSRLFDDKKPQ